MSLARPEGEEVPIPTAPWPLEVVEAVEMVNIARVPEALVEVAKVKALARSFFREGGGLVGEV